MHNGGDRGADQNGDNPVSRKGRSVGIPVVSGVPGWQVAGVCNCRKDAEGRVLICERFRQRAISLVLKEKSSRRSTYIAAAAGVGGVAVGLLLDSELAVLAIIAAIGAALAYAFNR